MKAALVFCLGMMLPLVTQPLLAQDETPPVGRFTHATIEQVKKSLRTALETPSPSLQITAAYTTRQLKELLPDEEFSSLVIPLMRIVKDENAETSARMVAAVTLHRLHSATGDFAISRTAQFTDNARVKNICSLLTSYQRREKLVLPVDVSTLRRLIEFPAPEPLPEEIL